MIGFRDDLIGEYGEMDSCLLCSSPTKSHLVLLAYKEGEGSMVAVSDLDDGDGFGMVCHSCATEHHSDANAVARAYDERLDEILARVGDVDKEMLAQRPDLVDAYEFECECGERLDADDLVQHLDGHEESVIVERTGNE